MAALQNSLIPVFEIYCMSPALAKAILPCCAAKLLG